jgi:outer membrane protein OmpA-like peptidoglycan-associated protein
LVGTAATQAWAQDQRQVPRDFFQFPGSPPTIQQPVTPQVIYSQWPVAARTKLQEALIWTGYYPGPPDGEIGERTLLAIRTFQRALGHPQTGLVTQPELDTLHKQAGRQIEKSGFQLLLDKSTGIGTGIPKAILSTTRPAQYGVDYFSPGERIHVGIRIFSQGMDIRGYFEGIKAALRGTSVQYSQLWEDRFIIAGVANDKKYYLRYHVRDGVLAGFFAIHDDSDPQFPPALSMISFSLRPLSAPPQLETVAATVSHLTEPISNTLQRVPPAVGPTLSQEGTLWDHNASVVRLLANGNFRKIVYEQPSPDLKAIDVSRGTTLFDGQRIGTEYRGVAYAFAKGCQPVPYNVAGRVISEEEIVLAGAAPILMASTCQAISHRSDVPHSQLRFVLRTVSRVDQLLLDSIQTFLERSGGKAPKFYRYVVPKNDAAGISADAPILRIVFEERVFFDTDKADILPEAESALTQVATALQQQNKRAALFVAGHTDSRGSDEYNLALSMRRAKAVAEALLTRGVGSASVWQVGFGKAVPLRPNDSDENMAINRRVEFLLATQEKAIAIWIQDKSLHLCEGEGCQLTPRVERTYIAVPATRPENRQLPEQRPIELELKPPIIEVPAPKL